MKNWTSNLLFNEAGDGTGGGGTNSLLTASQGGGQPATSKGSADPGTGAAGGNAPAGDANPSISAKGTEAQDWKLALPKELQEDASIKGFTSLPALVKSYVHAQKLIGADKIPVPSKHATEDDWKNVFHKLGLPEKMEEYSVTVNESVLPKETAEEFKKAAYAAGILPSQAQKISEWMEATNSKYLEDNKAKVQNEFKQELEGLKKEWGQAFDHNVAKARAVVSKFADPETVEYLEKSGLANNIKLVKLLAKAGDLLSEDVVVQAQGAGGGAKMAPAEAKSAAQKILGDFKHPYHIKDHPNHKAAVQEVADLFKMAYPQS